MSTRILPFIRDLNPQIDDLRQLIRLAKTHEGNRAALTDAIFEAWTKSGARNNFSKHSIQANTITSLAADNLGLLTDDARLTQLGRTLYKLRANSRAFKDALTEELLAHRGGWQFARALQTLGADGRRPTRQDISSYLSGKYGIDEWRDLNNISSIHNFLEWGGVVKNYTLVDAEFERLFRATTEQLSEFEALSQETRACFEALVRLGGSATPGDIRTVAEAALGRLIDVHQLPATLKPLIDLNLVDFAGKKGNKRSIYRIADQRSAETLALIASDLTLSGVVPDAVFEKSFSWIVNRLALKSLSPTERGKTLEVLAAKICWRIGLRHIQIRLRTEFEVDVVAERTGVTYERWSVQCKAFNSATVRSEHILREFGIAMLDGYDILLFVTTSDFTPDATRTITRIMSKTNLLIIPIDGARLRAFAANESAIFDFLQSRSGEARRIRVGTQPSAVLRELDSLRGKIMSEQPKPEEIWAGLARRDVFIDFHMFVAIFGAWLDGERDTAGFEEGYLGRVRALL